MKIKRVAIICPVHVRHRFIAVAREQFMKIPCDTRIFYFADRPTDAVVKAISVPGVFTIDMPWPIVDGAHGDFPRAWSHMVQCVEDLWRDVTFMGIWDDDMILTNPETVLWDMEFQHLVYGSKLFLWDDAEHFNSKLVHNSVVFWRHRRGDRFHDKSELQVHAPRRIHDDFRAKKGNLRRFILDYGFMSQKDRKCVFEREIRTGKIDGFTKPLMEPPELVLLPDDYLEQSRNFSRQFAPE
ncbi:MAG: hypothetical protein JXA57_06610 [Armatimonadetes bacterium]|nr:hypothetical protein [Armatimonadota bacterium]